MFSIGRRSILVSAAMLSFAMYTAPASAQATRTWVSGVGDDVNPCSRTAPCKTFAGTISKTAAGGEINCLDPGGFGGVTITKAMTILCDYTEAGLLISNSNAIVINAGDNDVVTLSGLDIFGPTSQPGLNGISFLNGAGLNVRNTTIKGMGTQGISFTPGAGDTAFLNLNNVTVTGTGTTGDANTGAIKIAPGVGATANVVIKNVRIQDSKNVGLRLDLTGVTGAKINAQVVDSVITNSAVGLLAKGPAGTGTVALAVTDTLIAGNTTSGVLGNGSGVVGRFANNTITGNGAASAAASVGVTAANASVLSSYNNNRLDGNLNSASAVADGAFSGTIVSH